MRVIRLHVTFVRKVLFEFGLDFKPSEQATLQLCMYCVCRMSRMTFEFAFELDKMDDQTYLVKNTQIVWVE